MAGPWPHRWAIALVLAAACGKAAPSAAEAEAYVLELDATSSTGFSGRGQSAWAQDVGEQGLAHARWFRAEGEGPRLEARLRYDQRTIEGGIPVLRVHLVVEPDAELAARLDELGLALDAYVELERRDQTIELGRDLPYAVERAVAVVDAKVTIVRGTDDDLAALLDDPDPEVVLVVLDGIGRRRLTSLGDAVAARLHHEDERVALASMDCLGVIGGPEHAAWLLRAANLADPAQANRLYDALANLGGEDARGFLSFAARNEDDPDLAVLAERALAKLEEKEPAAGTSDGLVTRGHRQ